MDLGSSSGHGSLSYKKDKGMCRVSGEEMEVRSKACLDINGSLCRKRTPDTAVNRVTTSQDGVLAFSFSTIMTAVHGARQPAPFTAFALSYVYFANVPALRVSLELPLL